MTPTDRPTRQPRRVLAIVSRFKWQHIDYLRALAERFDLVVAWEREGHEGATQVAARLGLRLRPLGEIGRDGLDDVRTRLAAVLDEWQPEIVHLMYYLHERLTLLVRELAGHRPLVVFECRDPLTTLVNAAEGSEPWRLEGAALRASDVQILVSPALRRYYEELHGLDLSATSLVVPHAFARGNAGPLSPKLSARDGQVHMALVGTAVADAARGRWYGDIIRRLVGLGYVVHSHFHEFPGASLAPYAALARELDRYHFHPTVSFRDGTALSAIVSSYDLMGVFHELGAPSENESATLAVCMPTKATCGWLHGAIPVVCFPHYQGLADWINARGIGFVVRDWDDLGRLREDREAIAEATARCVEARDQFSNEWNAARIEEFVEWRLSSTFRPGL